jgi:hypothetical protein
MTAAALRRSIDFSWYDARPYALGVPFGNYWVIWGTIYSAESWLLSHKWAERAVSRAQTWLEMLCLSL